MSRLDFKTATDAKLAADILIEQVLIGTYRTLTPGNIKGCGSSTCDIYIPYSLFDTEYAEAAVAANRNTGRQFVGVAYLPFAYSTAADPAVTFAKFTSQMAAVVPEPATWGLMLVGFGMVGGASRYCRRSTKGAAA